MILDRTVIRRDQTSGAETEIRRLETEERYKPVSLDRALRILGDDARPIVNRKSGRAAIRCSTYSLTDDEDRKSVVSGKSVSVRVDLGGRRIIKKKKKKRTRVTQVR